MKFRIRKAAVLGAGVMGSGIAAHLANAGIPVLLLDIVPPKAAEGEKTDTRAFRNKFASNALVNLRKQKPAPLMTEKALALIEVGNLEDDLKRVAECDWVVEVIKEDLALKNALFARLEAVVSKTAIVSSNTSGMSIKGMTEGRSDDFKRRFLVTHFFNPVRYMKLLELVPGEHTAPETLAAFAEFGERVLGKGIVYGKDTTNFIANRIGTYGMMRTLQLMKAHGLVVEEIDKIFGPALGRPKSAVFRTADLVGLDTFIHVTRNCYDSLPGDEARDVFAPPAFLLKMVEKGMLGDKSGGGFYKKSKGGEGEKEILALDLDTLEYRKQGKVRFESLGAAKDAEDLRERIKIVLTGTDKAAKFAEVVTLDTLAYAARRMGEIADDLVNIDRGVRWGFGWEMGPFETWDAYGVAAGVKRMKELSIAVPAWVEKMLASGRTSFYGVDGVYDTYWDVKATRAQNVPTIARQVTVEGLKRGNKKIDGNDSASVWDMGDGVVQLEFHSKMNSIDTMIIEMMDKAIDVAQRDFRGIVIGNDGGNFSAGANIAMLLWAIKDGQWDDVKKLVRDFQNANQRMRYCGVPSVSAPFGLTLGGGCEVTMGANAVQAAAETYIGLVEVGVGLIPGGGGNLFMLRNLYGAPRRLEGLRPAALPQEGLPRHRHRQGRHQRGRGQGSRLPAARRRHLDEPRPPAGRRQGPGHRHGRGRLPPAARPHVPAGRPLRRRHHRHDAVRHGAQPPDQRLRPPHRQEAGDRADRRRHRHQRARHRAAAARSRAGGLPLAVRRDQDPGPHPVHAREGQAAAQLIATLSERTRRPHEHEPENRHRQHRPHAVHPGAEG